MRRVFVDTSAFFALAVSKDENHFRTRDLFAQAERESWRLVTTNAVVFETHALLLNRSRPGRQKALEFLEAVQTDTYHVVRVRKTDEDKAIALVRSHADKIYSLCDALSFAVMERLRIRDAISFDQDFRSYGRFDSLTWETTTTLPSPTSERTMKTHLDMNKIAKGWARSGGERSSPQAAIFGRCTSWRRCGPGSWCRPVLTGQRAARSTCTADSEAARRNHGQGPRARRRQSRTDAARGAALRENDRTNQRRRR